MFVVGITGGIGSGKTAVSDTFSKLGITVVDADTISRVVVAPGTQALSEIRAHFSDGICQPDGSLDRAALRKLVFANATERKWLESLLHPLMAKCIVDELETASSQYAILVSPLLFEIGQHLLCDRVLVVDVSEELQLERTMARDNNSAEQVKAIMAAQADRQARLSKSDDVIVNDGTLESLEAKVLTLHKHYLQLAAEKTANAKDKC